MYVYIYDISNSYPWTNKINAKNHLLLLCRTDTDEGLCIIYVHGNSGGRLDVIYNGILDIASEKGLSLVAFDCVG
jgi:hypothetical protein